MIYTMGLDLGQATDFTAIAAVERLGPAAPMSLREQGSPATYHCRHLERLACGTPYPAIADHVTRLLATPALVGRCRLVVDATGVGRPVVEMLEQRGLGPITITVIGGDTVTGESQFSYRVPKRDLVSLLQVTLQTERLKFAAELAEVPTLVRELMAFRVKPSDDGQDAYGAWRERTHDDLVLALACAVWVAETWREPLPRRTGIGSATYSGFW